MMPPVLSTNWSNPIPRMVTLSTDHLYRGETIISSYCMKVSSIYLCFSFWHIFVLFRPNFFLNVTSYCYLTGYSRRSTLVQMRANYKGVHFFLLLITLGSNHGWFYLKPYANHILIEKLPNTNKG